MIEILFTISLIVFLGLLVYIFINLTPPEQEPPDVPSSGTPIPTTSYIGQGDCPVACTCFPKQTGAGTFCAYLDNGEMFACPKNCCTPSCF